MAVPVQYSPRIAVADWLRRGVGVTLQLPVYRDGSLQAPTVSGSSFTLRDPNGVDVITDRAITVSGSIAQVALADTDLPSTLSYAAGYRERWTLVMPDGHTHLFERGAAVTRSNLYPVVTDDDLLALYPDLNSYRPSSLSSWQGQIDAAWKVIVGRLQGDRRWPYLIMEAEALREVLVELTLGYCFNMAATSTLTVDNRFGPAADRHMKNYSYAYKRLRFEYDVDNDGTEGGQVSAAGALFTSHSPASQWTW